MTFAALQLKENHKCHRSQKQKGMYYIEKELPTSPSLMNGSCLSVESIQLGGN